IVTIAGCEPPLSGNPREAFLPAVSGLTVEPAGRWVYFADAGRGVIGRFDADGTKLEVVAGNQLPGFNGDGRPALETSFAMPVQIALDPRNGDLYVADSQNRRVRVIPAEPAAPVRTVAGLGIRGVDPTRLAFMCDLAEMRTKFSGDGGLATEAELGIATGVAVDKYGIVYISDSGNNRIRALNTTAQMRRVAGVSIAPSAIQTIAGNGAAGGRGDGGPALSASLNFPRALSLDTEGNLIVADTWNNRLRRIRHDTGVIESLVQGPQPDRAATGIAGVTVTPSGGIVFSDLRRNALFDIGGGYASPSLLAGIGVGGVGGDADTARASILSAPAAIASGPNHEIYFAEAGATRIRKLAGENLRTIAGHRVTHDKTPARSASFAVLGPISVGAGGAIYVADALLHTILRIDPTTGLVDTFAGTGVQGDSGDGGPPECAEFDLPLVYWSPSDEAFYVADELACRVRRIRITPQGSVIEAVAGTGQCVTAGDGGPATAASLAPPIGVIRNPRTGDRFISSLSPGVIRRIDSKGTITTYAGNGVDGFGGDGGKTTAASFNWPTGMAIGPDDTLYVCDFHNHRIRAISPDGTIRTFAGTGRPAFDGDGGPAAQASFDGPNSLAFDSAGNLYVTDTNNNSIRRISASRPHRITTVVGCGERGFSGDGGSATRARLNTPRGIALSADGILYITDSVNHRIRAVRLR